MLCRRVARNYTLYEIIERSRNSRRESLIVSPFYFLRRCVRIFFFPRACQCVRVCHSRSILPCLSSFLIRSSRDLIVCRSCREHDLASFEIRKRLGSITIFREVRLYDDNVCIYRDTSDRSITTAWTFPSTKDPGVREERGSIPCSLRARSFADRPRGFN